MMSTCLDGFGADFSGPSSLNTRPFAYSCVSTNIHMSTVHKQKGL
jgi:hypothetical protein